MDPQNITNLPFPDLDLLFVEGGEFLMGDEVGDLWEACRPVHPVKVPSFYMAKFPVTQRLYQAVMEGVNPFNFKGDLRPVEKVSWDDARLFIEKLNLKLASDGVTWSHAVTKLRLPTEAEWEYAARGGNKSEGFRYAGSNEIKEVAWYDDNSYGETKAVGLKYPNELGIYDMSGNVWEWCEDRFDSRYYEQCKAQGLVENPKGPDKGGFCVRRGGSYFYPPLDCRSASRLSSWSEDRPDYLGFRLALSFQSVG